MSYNNSNYGAPSQGMYQQPQAQYPSGRPQSFYGQSQQPQQQHQQQQSALRNNSSQLWMGELDPFWDEMYVKSIWANFGFPTVNVKMIKDVKLVQSQAYNVGYCFVEFPNLEVASNALSKSGSRIPNTNKTLKLNWASGGSSAGNTLRGGNSNEISIFVGDLSPDVTESILFEYFGTKYSSVSATKIMLDQQTGLSKGYGFVRFLNEADQQRALAEMQGAILNGRPMRVSTAVPKNRQQNQFPQRSQSSSFTSASSNAAFQQQGLPPQQFMAPQQTQQALDSQFTPPLNQFTDPNNTTVFIGGLSSIVTEDDLRLYFQPFGDITYVKIPVGKGCGFVQFTTRASAELAISKMQGYPIGNSRIRLSWGRSNANPKPQQYRSQPELPVMHGFEQQHQTPLVPQPQNEFGLLPPQQVGQQPAQFVEQSENDEQRLNQLYTAARDGRLDAIDSASNGYIFA